MSAPSDVQYGVVPMETLRTLSGLEFLSKLLARELPAPPISRMMGFELSEVRRGEAVFTCTPTWEHYNPIGSVHGGLAGTLLDSAMGCAVQSQLEAGQGYTTLEYRVHLVRALTDKTGPIRAEAKVVHAGRRAATAEGRIVDAKGNLYAHGTTTCMIFEI